ncbi:MAG: cupin domain-containing protein [Myxococcales bacterium]|nr:cupin domain-containing protein [Myxococcales bacterium]
MHSDVINLREKLGLFSDHWAPRVIAALNDYQLKLARVKGAFVWHQHADTDEMFYVVDGALRIELEDRTVCLNAGELFVVPKGAMHRPVADEECCILLIEPRGVVNTGEAGGEYTAPNDRWV